MKYTVVSTWRCLFVSLQVQRARVADSWPRLMLYVTATAAAATAVTTTVTTSSTAATSSVVCC